MCCGRIVFGKSPWAIIISLLIINVPIIPILISLYWVLDRGAIMLSIGLFLVLICNLLMFRTASKDPGILKRSTETI